MPCAGRRASGLTIAVARDERRRVLQRLAILRHCPPDLSRSACWARVAQRHVSTEACRGETGSSHAAQYSMKIRPGQTLQMFDRRNHAPSGARLALHCASLRNPPCESPRPMPCSGRSGRAPQPSSGLSRAGRAPQGASSRPRVHLRRARLARICAPVTAFRAATRAFSSWLHGSYGKQKRKSPKGIP